jgi:hypothetical protein
MEADDGVSLIVGPAENLSQLQLRELLSDLGDFAGRFAERFLALFIFGEIEKEARLFELGAILLPRVEDVFEARLLLENSLRLVGVVPEIGLGGELVQLFGPLLLAVEVKDASGEARASLAGESVALGFLRM